jgi:hypothetical protein
VAAAAPAMAADGTPTFTKDVAPIFYKSCIECHRATMFAPMSLTSYEDARPWLRSIKQRVTERTMPPWGSDMPHGVLRNDPRLTDQEIQTIVSWIDGGAPKGDIADMPKMPALADGWTIGKPDAVYSMTEDYKIPAAGTIEYLYLRIPVNLPEDRWYTAVEIKPSARAHVHHIIAYTEPSSDSRRVPAAPSGRRTSPACRRTSRASSSSPASRSSCARPRHHPADALHDQRHGSRRSHAGGVRLRQGAAEADPRHRPGGAAALPDSAGDPNAEVKASPRSDRTRS